MSHSVLARLLASAALVFASAVQGASATPHRMMRAVPNRLSSFDEAGRSMRGRQFGGGFGGGVRPDVPLTARFDVDKNGRLNADERRAAREYAESAGLNRGRGGRFGGQAVQVTPGPRVEPTSVRTYPTTTSFYDEASLRTLFLTFENQDWERELMAFKTTDIEVPAALTIDGRAYRDVGIQFHGNSSFSGVPMGLKHSIHLSLDFVHDKQEVGGYRSLTLLNAHEDPTLLRTVLYMHIARDYLPAPKANFVRVVINGESWGIYASQQQFNKEFTRESFKTAEGARWKVPGSPGSRSGGLSYLGDDVNAYKRAYEIKSKDDPNAWAALVNVTRVLNQTPTERLEATLAPLLDIDGALRFLAVDNALVNNDGYWTRGSDYSLYLDPAGRFHVIPYDANETFATGRGGGFGGRGGTPDLDPLRAADDDSKALASRLLAVPALRAKYLAYVRDIATKWLDWARLGPLVTAYEQLIANDVRTDTRKLNSTEEFDRGAETLKGFAAERRSVLLNPVNR